METLRRDIQFALRAWRRRPLLALVIVLTLGFGFSATSVVFSVVNAVLIAPLPYRDPEDLLVIRASLPGQQQAMAQLSGPEVLAVQERATALQAAGGVWARPGVIGTAQDAAEIEIGFITPGFLESFGVAPQLGRLPTPDEHQRTDVIVLSDLLWRQRFGGDASIVGRRIDFDEEPRTVVAVMPAGFRMLLPPADGVPDSIQAWLPWAGDLGRMSRGFRVFTVVGRIGNAARGSGAVEGGLASLARAIASESADYARSGFALSAEPLAPALVARVRPTLLVLLCVVVLVWIIACANVANLLLIRGVERSTEFSVRLALGAGRRRVWRQILTESALVGIAGAAAGLLFAQQAIAGLRQLGPEGIPRVQDAALDPPTLAASAVVAVAAAIFFGSVAARHAVSAAPLGRGGRGASSRSTAAQRLLVVTQVGLSVVLLTGAGLLVRSTIMLRAIDLGFAPDHVISMRISLPDVRYPYATAGPAIAEFYRQLDESLRDIPGVLAAGATLGPPLSDAQFRARPYAYRMNDRDLEWGAAAATYRTVTPGWFAAARVRLVAGRLLADTDRWDRPLAVVVDTTLARKAWPGQPAIGKAIRVELFRNGAFTPSWGEVVGVIDPVRTTTLTGREREQVYLAHHQAPQRTMFPAIMTSGDPAQILSQVQRAVQERQPGLPVFDVRLYTGYVAGAMAQTRFAMIALGGFASLAVVLAAAGLFAALSASIALRTREIGIRLALGSSPAGVFRWTVLQGLRLAAIGIAAGLAAAAALTRFLSSLLFNVSATDGLTMGAVVVLVAATALAASTIPARKAAYIDPCDSLKAT
jgi:putative ABC transport system permease protein